MTPNDFLFRGELAELDPDVAELVRQETARQERFLIMIPSESTIPEAVREALMSSFHNIYAEGYPLDETRTMTQQEILDYGARLPEYRRQADKRYYKGAEYANIVESLARRRVAELFATDKYPAEKLFVNVQPLSGAPANSAIFSGLINVGDTVMGLDLLQGGHLTHGSPVARSGKQYKATSYGVDPVTERLDYDAIRALALQHRPRILIAGYTSYPFPPDWAAFRSIADEVGAYLMADVSHVAGLIIAGDYPNPVGYADVISFTTHKTLGGPRGAVIITHRSDVASKVDRAVFPGEQGGPHVNQIAALAVAMRLATTEQFRELQHQTVKNATRLAEKLESRGIRVAYGGTGSHMVLIDCKSVVGPDGTPLSGDMAARILDLAGIVANRNTIPGDPSALRASGVRLGTPWITQRGFREKEIDQLGDLIADLLAACVPFSYTGKKRAEPRAKVDFATLERVKLAVKSLAESVGIDTDSGGAEYPHVTYLNTQDTQAYTLFIRDIGHAAPAAFLNAALSSDVLALGKGQSQPTSVLNPDGSVMAHGTLERTSDDRYLLHVERGQRVASWLRGLSDGFVLFDPADPYAKVPGPVDVQVIGRATALVTGGAVAEKAYAVGFSGEQFAGAQGSPLPVFSWTETEGPVKYTPLHALHLSLKAKMAPFAGYDMPLWYSSVSDEHHAVRKTAGVFDVTHMGVFDAYGPGAEAFLDAVTTNDLRGLAVGDSHYTYFLDTDGVPLDDLMIYRLAGDHFLVVVNASNNDKNWAWLNAVKSGTVMIDPAHPSRRVAGGDRVTLRDLRDPQQGPDQRLDIALQGPNSKAILLGMADDASKAKLSGMAWANVVRATLNGVDVIVSRTGYTGERVAYELFVHPDHAVALFTALIQAGAAPCGLAARDSLRTEAGLPLYGHELGVVLDGALTLNPADAGFGNYVKLWKPFFVGKAAFVAHEQKRDAEIARFRLNNRGARPPHPGDPIVDARGRVVGVVTSCSIDSEGYQLGQVYLKQDVSADGTQLAVFCGAGRSKEGKPLSALGLGDRAPMPEPVTIISRFPKKASS
ncbi:MAG: serine hydroxymethyltransferase [Pleurocapsa minor GSE-CHR-MK-17-07R]|jgi:glycine hydroxymethyltransferase|nr:serine hydroxymethyltransferase [Pleurocapsa minor GSE-CHR-MK 17-07R]